MTVRLPDFLIVGAMRSGTTTLARTLQSHPEVFVPENKEVHFFDRNFERGVTWYASFFEAAEDLRSVGEATPEYMYDARARERMSQTLPSARLIVILRDPIERAYSHYWHERNLGREDLSFEAAIAAESSRLESPDPVTRSRVAYVDRGLYVQQLEALNALFPRDAIHVLLFEDFVEEPQRSFGATTRFLGLEDGVMTDADLRNWNPTRVVRRKRLRRLAKRLPSGPIRRAGLHLSTGTESYPPMSETSRAELAERFRLPNRDLERWLGRDLPWS